MESITKSGMDSDLSQSKPSIESQSSESREMSYIQFMSSIPRLCSPTICGTTNYKTPDRAKWQPMAPLDDSSYRPFEWSIEQKALLDPCDFSNTEDLDLFRQIDEKIVSKQLDEENDWFFSQKHIIPSPTTPQKVCKEREESMQMTNESIGTNRSKRNKTPEYANISAESLVIDCFKTPLNCSKTRQKKKLFAEQNHYMMDSHMSRSPKDSAIDTIESRSLLSPIYSPDWRNTSLSNRITHLSPICSQNRNYVELDFGFDNTDNNSLNDRSMYTEGDSCCNLTTDMLSIESQTESEPNIPNHKISNPCPDRSPEKNNLNAFRESNRCEQKTFQRFFAKTSTPSHL